MLQSNLLAIPGYVLFALNVLIAGWLSERFKERSLVAALSNIWMLPFFIVLVCIPDSASPWVRYAMLTGINGIPYTHSILVGMTSANAKTVSMRAVSTAVYNMSYQVGSIVAVNVYREEVSLTVSFLAPLSSPLTEIKLNGWADLLLLLLLLQTTQLTRHWWVSVLAILPCLLA